MIKRNYDPATSGKKIAIATVIISGKQQHIGDKFQNLSYNQIVSFGTRSKELYAKKHGYDFIVAMQKLNDCYGVKASRDLECAWTKLALVSRVLDDYDWVFWSDADSVILNFDIKLESFIDEDYDVIACMQRVTVPVNHYAGPAVINTGEVFYKNCQFSKDLISGAWADHHKKTLGSFEQARINKWLKQDKERGEHVLVYSGKAFNLTPVHYEVGDFLIHMYAYHGRYLYWKFLELEQQYGWILDEEEKIGSNLR